MSIENTKAKKRLSEEAMFRHRVARTIRMLGLLTSGPIYNSKRLADELSVSKRTVYRDLRALREAGVAVLIDKWSEAYYVRAQREPGQIPLRYDQAVLLALAAHLSPLNCNQEFATKIRSAISGLIAGLPHSSQMDISRLLSRAQGETYPISAQVMDEVICAVRRKQPFLALAETERGIYGNLEIVPSHLVATMDGWQLHGRLSGDSNVRVFNVRTFLRVELIEQSPKISPLSSRATREAPLADRKAFRRTVEPIRKAKLRALARAG